MTFPNKAVAALAATLAINAVSPALHAQTSPAQPVVLSNETILRVSGEGTIEAAPEIMEVEIGVVTSGRTSNEALAENSRQVQDLVAAIRAMGVPPEDVETARLNVEPRYAERGETNAIIGWQAENILRVRTDELERAGEIVTALFDAGGNNISTPQFILTDESNAAVARRAEAEALSEAREQADAVAQTMDMRVSRVLLISDAAVRFSRQGSAIVVSGSRINRPAVPVEPAEVEVTATYNVEFALVPN